MSKKAEKSEKTAKDATFDEIRGEVDDIRLRLNTARQTLASFFVSREEVVDLLFVCTAAQEPLLLVGPPGTAKSALATYFCQAIGIGGAEYFEYVLTKFTEPSELFGPVDMNQLREGKYIRRSQGKLPEAKVAFLDEIFKSNSAILNTLLTVLNERKYYQDGQPVRVPLQMLIAATNRVPDFEELAALRDRFAIKVETTAVKDTDPEALLEKGLQNELDRAFERHGWAGLCKLDDFAKIKRYLDGLMAGMGEAAGRGSDANPIRRDRERYFSPELWDLFKSLVRSLEKECRVQISDRRFIKLYRLVRTRAFLFHGGNVQKEDLSLLRYVGDRSEDFTLIRDRVESILRLQ